MNDTLEAQYRVNPRLRVIFTSDDEILIKHGARSPTSRIVRDDGRTRLLGTVLRGLQSHGSLAALLERRLIPADQQQSASELIEYLHQEQVLQRAGEDVVQTYLSSVVRAPSRLTDARVVQVGAGYLGSRIAEELVRLQIGELTLLDDRSMQSAELDRRFFQLPPRLVQTGRSYVGSVVEHLQQGGDTRVLGQHVSVLDKDALRAALASAHLVVVAAESMSLRLMHTVNEVALELRKPWLAVQMDGSEAFVGPLFVPGESACYNEFQLQHEASSGAVKDEYLTYKEALNSPELRFEHLSLPPFVQTACGFAATAVMRFLSTGKCFLLGRCLRIDFERLSVDTEEVLRLPRCPACSPYKPYRHTYL